MRAFLVLLLGVMGSSRAMLKDTTGSALSGMDLNVLPMAFLDFNGDKLTDIAVLSNTSETLMMAIAKRNMLTEVAYSIDRNLQCSVKKGKYITSVIPGDFDGNGIVDIVAVVIDYREKLSAHVLWVDRLGDGHTVNCSNLDEDGIPMSIQPILLDANGDQITDLFGVNDDYEKGFWIFSRDRSKPPVFKSTQIGLKDSKFAKPKAHSNAFLDMNDDGNADIFVTRGNHFEIWLNNGGGIRPTTNDSEINFVHHKNVAIKECENDNCNVGQVAFADFDKDGKIDILFPVSIDNSEGVFYFGRLIDMFAEEDFTFKKLKLEAPGWKLDFRDSEKFIKKKSPYEPLTPRVGDLNLDGFPDLLVRMKNLSNEFVTTQFLLNVQRPELANPSFELQTNVLDERENLVAATFFDLYDDGRLDVLGVQELRADSFKMSVFSNGTFEGINSFFIKMHVMSGICSEHCPGSESNLPFGANLNGQTVCYRREGDPAADPKLNYEACAPQMPQTAHTALQTPEIHFGLESAISSVEAVNVRVTNASNTSLNKTFFLVILNAQLYILPSPPSEPNNWEMKIFILPRAMMTTGLCSLAIMGCLCVIIVILHIQEQRLDRREKLQGRNIFHFNAM